MKQPAVILLALLIQFAATAAAEVFLVKDGQPRAEIVVATTAKRTTRLAAQELQDGIKKDRKSTRLNSSHSQQSRMPSSA